MSNAQRTFTTLPYRHKLQLQLYRQINLATLDIKSQFRCSKLLVTKNVSFNDFSTVFALPRFSCYSVDCR